MLNIEDYDIKIYNFQESIGGFIYILDNENKKKKIKPLVMIKITDMKVFNDLLEILKIIKNDNLNISKELINSTNKMKEKNTESFGLSDLLESSFEYNNNEENLNKSINRIRIKKRIYKIQNNKLIFNIKNSNFFDGYYEIIYEFIWIINHVFYISKRLIIFLLANFLFIYFTPHYLKSLTINIGMFIIILMLILSLIHLKNNNGYYIEMNFNLKDYINYFQDESLHNINKKLILYFEYLLSGKLRKKVTPYCYRINKNLDNIHLKYHNKKPETITQEIKYFKNKIYIVENKKNTMVRFFILKLGKNNISIKIYNTNYEECIDYSDLISNFYFDLIKSKTNYEFIKKFEKSKSNILGINTDIEFNKSFILRKTNISSLLNSNTDKNKIDINKVTEECNNYIHKFNLEIDDDKWIIDNLMKKYKLFYINELENDENEILKKLEIVYKCNISKIFKLYKDFNNEIKFNKNIEDINILHNYSDNLMLTQTLIKKRFPIKKREFISFQFDKDLDDIKYIIRYKAPDHWVDENEEIVRGEIIFEGMKFIKLDENKTKLILISKLNSKLNYIPKYLLKKELIKLSEIPLKYNEWIN